MKTFHHFFSNDHNHYYQCMRILFLFPIKLKNVCKKLPISGIELPKMLVFYYIHIDMIFSELANLMKIKYKNTFKLYLIFGAIFANRKGIRPQGKHWALFKSATPRQVDGILKTLTKGKDE